MIEILEYIMAHYTWFLGGAILILLAIIGYYADKTNFGQGQNVENKENKKQTNIENVGLSDITEEIKSENEEQITNLQNDDLLNQDVFVENNLQNDINTEENINLENNEIVIQEQENQSETNELIDLATPIEETTLVDEINLGDNSINEIPVEDIKNIEKQENKTNSLLTEEEVNKFNDEFESLVPKKELINTDLLSDIDILELDKTQKFDLSAMPDLDDIELPKIKNIVEEEQDIWKF